MFQTKWLNNEKTPQAAFEMLYLVGYFNSRPISNLERGFLQEIKNLVRKERDSLIPLYIDFVRESPLLGHAKKLIAFPNKERAQIFCHLREQHEIAFEGVQECTCYPTLRKVFEYLLKVDETLVWDKQVVTIIVEQQVGSSKYWWGKSVQEGCWVPEKVKLLWVASCVDTLLSTNKEKVLYKHFTQCQECRRIYVR